MSDFGFKYWPFQIAAGSESGISWADRTELRLELDSIVRGVKPNRPTTLINIWAFYGAGKTYALRYLQHQATQAGIFAIYCTTPQGASGFVNLYRAIISALGTIPGLYDLLEESLREARTDTGQSITQACKFLSIGNPSQAAEGFSYLSGAKTTARARRDLGVTADIADANIACAALTEILTALGSHSGVLLLLDEVQDLSGMKERALAETTGILQKVFDGVPRGFRLIVSFTTGNKETIGQVLGPALSNRSSKTISIPEFSPSEAVEFLGDLIRQARENDADPNPFHPFTLSDLESIVTATRSDGQQLLPRALIIRANNILEDLASRYES
jgi:hypothetical protein